MSGISLQKLDELQGFQALTPEAKTSSEGGELLDEFSRILEEIASRVVSNFLQDRTSVSEAVGANLERREAPKATRESTSNEAKPRQENSEDSTNRTGKEAKANEVETKQTTKSDKVEPEAAKATKDKSVAQEAGSAKGENVDQGKSGKAKEVVPAEAESATRIEQLSQSAQEIIQEVSTAASADTQPKKTQSHDQQQRELLEQALREMMQGQESKTVEPVVAQTNDLASALASMIFRSQMSTGTVNSILLEGSAITSQSSTMTHQAVKEIGSTSSIGNKASEQVLKEMDRPLRGHSASQTMERVEQALNEAARSRDGKTISLRLDPPDLGKLKVDVSLREGVLHARLLADSPQVSQLLRERSFELQRMLRGLGLEVEQVSVSIRDAQPEQVVADQRGRDQSGAFNNSSDKDESDQIFGGSPSESSMHKSKTSVIEDHWVA